VLRVTFLIWVTLAVTALQQLPTDDEHSADSVFALSNAELRAALESPWRKTQEGLNGGQNEVEDYDRLLIAGIKGGGRYKEKEDYDRLLLEAVKRGGKQWEQFVLELRKSQQEALEKGRQVMLERWKSRLEGVQSRFQDGVVQAVQKAANQANWREVSLITAVRRVQKKPDPIQIMVDGNPIRECKLGELPTFRVQLTNLDSEKTPIRIQAGGNDRSGRLARWRFDVRDSDGNVVPPRIHYGALRGGISSRDTLEYGDSWKIKLRMGHYTPITRPGTYTVRILYHDQITIDNRDDVNDLILCASLPIMLTVVPLEVELSEVDRVVVRESIRTLPIEGPVKILRGTYSEDAHQFISPNSPSGKILTLGWRAVPGLIDAALTIDLDPQRRGKVLGLLFSISGHNDPRRESGVIGPFEARDSRYIKYIKKTQLDYAPLKKIYGKIYGDESVLTGDIDSEKQLRFANRWQVWKNKSLIKIRKTQ